MDEREHWAEVSELFTSALDVPPDQRSAFLDRQNPSLEVRWEVLELLADEDETGNDRPLDRPLFSLFGDSEASGRDPAIGRIVGAYRLQRLLGRGGMGTVYQAVRADGEIEQEVAVKLLYPELASGEVLLRFQAERQILARLNHPNIARLLDVGTTREGLPYLVMELVDGLPVDAFCRTNRLNIDRRLTIFRSICEAVGYAHRNLVVHRDLKPANVLVDREGRVKLLDFGIARLLDGPAMTQRNSPMTPTYAAPEQIRGERIDTRSDIYSLGVLLYELLTERRPHEERNPEALARAICEEDPRRPSTVGLPPDAAIEEPAKLERRLAGDLDNIILKAIRKEPERRFASVEQFSEDIRRHLAGLPVLSRPETLAYLSSKLVRRHPWAITAILLIALLTVALTVGTQIQSQRVEDQYRETLRQRDRAESATDFLVGVLSEGDPRKAMGNERTVAEALEMALRRLENDLQDEPRIRASLYDAVGRVYSSLERNESARTALETALALREETLDAEDPKVAESLHNLANLEHKEENLEAAIHLMRRAVSIQRSAYSEDNLDLAKGLSNLATAVAKADPTTDEAVRLSREALAIHERLLGADALAIAIPLNNHGNILRASGDYEQAELTFRRSLNIRRRLGEPYDPGLAVALNSLAMFYVDHLNRPAKALPLYRESLRIRRHVFGEGHVRLIHPLNNLALLLVDLEQYEVADSLLDEALLINGSGSNEALLKKNRALVLEAWGRYEACDKLASEVAPHLKQELRIAELQSIRGACLHGLGRRVEAKPLLIEGFSVLKKSLAAEERRVRQARDRLGAAGLDAP